MKPDRSLRFLASVAITIILAAASHGAAWGAVKEKVHDFDRMNGMGYRTGLTLDSAGNFWGIAPSGGAFGYGDVFELSRDASGRMVETVLYNFTNGSDGGSPVDDDGPAIDSAGNLYGTTSSGGVNNTGTVFELTHTASGWQESVLYDFTCESDGCWPAAGVVFDSAGNLYGTTDAGGPGGIGFGTAFELTPDSSGHWKETTLHIFSGLADGAGPFAGLVFDQLGNLYGSTTAGGNFNNLCEYSGFYGCGVVFKLTNTAGKWKEKVLYRFTGGADGAGPSGKLALDASGNVYGTTSSWGDPSCGCGTVFRISAPGFAVLHTFTGSEGAYPFEGVVLDASGNLYGSADQGGVGTCVGAGNVTCGTVFRMTEDRNKSWSLHVVYSFLGKDDGGEPFALKLDGSNHLFGTAGEGGYFGGTCSNIGCGVVFEFTIASTNSSATDF